MNPKQPQTYETHRQIVPLVHYIMLPVSFIAAIGGIVQAINSLIEGEEVLPSLLLFALGILVCLHILVSRSNATKVQDRIIRTEEDIRHFKLTGVWLDSRLTIKQLIALRFASDTEFPALCEQAARDNLAPGAIKKAIKAWRGDYFRV